jgi:hypothetical protein
MSNANSKFEMCAALSHEANRLYCLSIGDSSQPHWEDAPDWQKKSALLGVTYRITAQDWTPDRSHASWMDEKVHDGWTYGDVKDPIKKTHPCMVPYEQLPEAQRVKDSIFGIVVWALYQSLP